MEKSKKMEKSEITNKLEEVLMYYGCEPGKSPKANWTCVPNRHNGPNPDLSIKGDVCCCHCGIAGDAINVIKIMEGYSNDKEGFLNALKKGYEILNFGIYVPEKFKIRKKTDSKTFEEKDFTKIINEKFKKAKRGDYQYFYNRGITNDNVFLNVKPIVGIPTSVFPHANTPSLANIYDYNYMIPVWENNKVVNCILRRNDEKSTYGNKVVNLKNLNVKFFNSDCLRQKDPNIIFITEGIFDALSFMEFFQESICLNSGMMANRFCETIEKEKETLNNKMFVIALDNDKIGKEATRKIKEKFNELNIKYVSISLDEKYKDINDYLVADRVKFIKSMFKAIEYCEKKMTEVPNEL